MENAYKSAAFAPWWFFGGFREVALAAMFYHQVMSPFSVVQASRDFVSPKVALLTREQERLRQRQDEVGRALSAARRRDARWSSLAATDANIYQRLGEIRHEKKAEVDRLLGSKAQWRTLEKEFAAMVRGAEWRQNLPFVPATDKSLSDQLLRYFEAAGDFYVDSAGRGPWMRLHWRTGRRPRPGCPGPRSWPGIPRVAQMVLAAVIDYNLRQSEARRERVDYVDGLLTMFRQATMTPGLAQGGVQGVSQTGQPHVPGAANVWKERLK